MSCQVCGGYGWTYEEYIDRYGRPYSMAKRCACKAMPEPQCADTLTMGDCMAAVLTFGRTLSFFPRDEPTLNFLAVQLWSMVNTPGELHWLVQTACGVITDWRGFATLRGIYCEGGYTPRDGVKIKSDIAGLIVSNSGSEQRRFEIEAAETERRMLAYRAEAKRLGQVPEPLPEIKRPPPLPEKPRRRTPDENQRLLEELTRQLEELKSGD